jgi:hypothetical protein
MAADSIPTLYEGIVYRSKTEAKHARFLDYLAIPREYEEQGYRSSGTNYLPDFKVRGALGLIFIEIKGKLEDDPEGVARWRKFAAARPQPSRAALLIGAPSLTLQTIVIGGDEAADDPVLGPWEADDLTWRPCPAGKHFDLAYPGHFKSKFAEDGCEQKFGGLGLEEIHDAVTAAHAEQYRMAFPAGTRS